MTNQPSTAVAVIEQSPDAIVEWNLDNWPSASFNRLVPTQTLGLVTDLIRPIVQVVQLDLDRDTYESPDLPKGHRAPNAKGLALLAGAAGVDFPNEERTDDGSDPKRAAAKVWATMVDGAGRTRTVVGSRDYVLDSLPMTDNQRKRAQGHIYEHAVTRARHRALRVLLGLAQSYPIAELQKPFAVVSYVPNLQHPELREAYKAALLPTVAAMYGPGAAKQLSAGPDVIDLDREGELKDVTPATPTALPGESLAKAAPEEPDWIRQAATSKAEPSFVEAIRSSALSGEDPEALATKAELDELAKIFDGTVEEITTGGLKALWPDQPLSALTSSQAQAIVKAHDSMGSEPFAAAWRAAGEAKAVAA